MQWNLWCKALAVVVCLSHKNYLSQTVFRYIALCFSLKNRKKKFEKVKESSSLEKIQREELEKMLSTILIFFFILRRFFACVFGKPITNVESFAKILKQVHTTHIQSE